MTGAEAAAARTRIKVCGVTRLEDAMRAAELGADAVGFVFAPGSRRRADPAAVEQIVRVLPPFLTTVGVFLDQPADEVRAVARRCRLDLVQLHGAEGPEYVAALRRKVLKAVCVAGPDDLAELDRYPDASAFLLDAAGPGGRGGTGRTFDWRWAVAAQGRRPVVLAGGLHPGNVAEAIRRVRPWAVDACTGTEAAPGVKDPDKLRAFFQAVRAADEAPRD